MSGLVPPRLSGMGDVAYDHFGKLAFASQSKALLRRIAKQLGLQKGQFDLRYNPGGIAVSGEATLQTDRLYLQVSQLFGRTSLLYRTCNSRKDYCGGTNHHMEIRQIASPAGEKKLLSTLRAWQLPGQQAA